MSRNRRRAAMPRVLLPLGTCLLLLVSCQEPNNERPPDPLLQDSLGLSPNDQVWRVELGSRDNREHVEPPVVTVSPGSWVEFVTTDTRLHTVLFPLDSLPAPSADFLLRTGQTASPPLVEEGARFVMSFEEAPAGRYPFLVEGNGVTAVGAVVVAEEER